MKRNGGLLKLFIASCFLCSCISSTLIKDKLNLAFSAAENDRFYVTQAIVDEKISVPVGNIGCCAGSAGAIVGNFDFAPQHLTLIWIDRKTKGRYFAHLDFPSTLLQQIKGLPEYFLIEQNRSMLARPYLIISISEENQVVSWLSNARSDGDNIRQRVLIELTRESGDLLR